MTRGGVVAMVLMIIAIMPACTPVEITRGPDVQAAIMTDQAITTTDGYALPMQSWKPADQPPKAAVIAVHGFNDYSNFFQEPGEILAEFGVLSYAYDQRGFGGTEARGFWHGGDVMAGDLLTALRLIKARHPQLPLYILGSSMGGAVSIRALGLDDETSGLIAGTILVAPAVWGRETMPWYQTSSLWLAAHTTPWLELTGRGLEITPSDNRKMLIALGKDPKIIKRTRVDAIWGLVNLMDDALAGAAGLDGRVLLLYGDRDDIVPKVPTYKMIGRMRENRALELRVGFYQMGYHMLLRDLAGPTVLKDIAIWMTSPNAPLPSGAEDWAVNVLPPDATQTTRIRPPVESALTTPGR